MTTVKDIMDFMQTVAPQYMKMEWDNVGLLCGSSSAPVSKILVALDPFEHVCQEAVDWGADLLVTHHSLIFRPISQVTDYCGTTRSIMKLCRHGINAFNAHTNLDCAPGGVNDVLAQTLGLSNIQVIQPVGQDAQGNPYGLLRMGEVKEQNLSEFLSHVKNTLGCDGLRYVSSGKPVRKVAVGGGSCADELLDAKAAGCDTFVTADVKYNQFWDAQIVGMNLIDAGHFHTENPVVAVLAQKIAAAFPHLEVKISETHADCVKYY